MMTRKEVWTAVVFTCLATVILFSTATWMSKEAGRLNAAAYEDGNRDAKILGEIREHAPPRPLLVTMTVRVRHARTWRSYVVRADTTAAWGELRGEALDSLVAEIKRSPSTLEQCEIEMGDSGAVKKKRR